MKPFKLTKLPYIKIELRLLWGEEVTVSPDSYRSYMPPTGEREWADPEKHGLSSILTYVYDESDKIDRMNLLGPSPANQQK
jgi:hypothetical protein